jgi:hypothetical protein
MWTLVTVLVGVSLLSACGGVGTATGPNSQPVAQFTAGWEMHASPIVQVENAPQAEASVIRTAATGVDADLVTAVTLGDPPSGTEPLAGYPGDRWLYIDVAIAQPQAPRVKQDWEAAMLAGSVRGSTASAGLPIPFGYSTIGVLPDGTRLEPVEIVIGSPITIEEAAVTDQAAEANRISELAQHLGLHVGGLRFKGGHSAPDVRLQTADSGSALISQWTDVVQTLFGSEPNTPWLLEIDDPGGAPIRLLANSPTTAGTTGWTRPDLRMLERDLGHD